MRVFSFLGFFLLLSCAQRFDEIENRLTLLEKQTPQTENTGALLVEDLEKTAIQNRNIADMKTQLTALRNDLTVTSGKVEVLSYEQKTFNARIDELTREIRKQLKEIQETKGVDQGYEEDFYVALRVHQEGNFEKSEKLFEILLSKYPAGRWSDRALFWLGEGFMARNLYKNAIAKFQDLIEKFPKSDKRCEAMSRQGGALHELGMQEDEKVLAEILSEECKKQ